jgi:hypothetical protein
VSNDELWLNKFSGSRLLAMIVSNDSIAMSMKFLRKCAKIKKEREKEEEASKLLLLPTFESLQRQSFPQSVALSSMLVHFINFQVASAGTFP